MSESLGDLLPEYKMKRKMLIGQILMLLMSVISSSLANENLKCYTDGIKLITCVWNTSSVEDKFQITPTTNCSLQSIDDNYIRKIPLRVNLEPLGGSQSKLRQGTLQFAESTLTDGSPDVPLDVRCENITNLLESIPEFYPPSFVKLYPPETPVVNKGNVTWKQGSPHSVFVVAVKYKVQWGLLENSWEKNQVALTEETQCELPLEKLIKGRQYVVRVQATPNTEPQLWSEWSPVTQWESTVGSPPPSEPIYLLLGVLSNITSLVIVAVGVVLLAFFCVRRYKRMIKCLYVPTPGKYFGDLFSDHNGDFKAWLGPIVNPEIYIKADSECISPVTIYKVCSSDMLSNKMEKDANLRDHNSSSFSISTYFLSQSSKCDAVVDQLEPCLADSPYGPAGGGSVQEKILPATHDTSHDNELTEVSMSTPLETSSSYKQLQKLRLDIQSPDSGFAGNSEEQESQEESGSEGLPSPPVVDNTLPISCILLCPVPQLKGLPHLGIPPGLTWNPQTNRTFTNLPSDISRNVLLGNSGNMACSGILEPSSDDYMPVKKVQG
ncbi:interleukin-2 receptor subunit beta-like isoform X2 [Neoarius graeffei]|uniref:interleukin-2 receptor subunit beta-like isoform X2 n=1 Tax=Neoarius graeffei TaxID=443677 RepID=UPI00298CF60A|nr:interleukin-2 receptor subunit beta-like isoform X2 [Neoarius graeffei]